jgi:type I restriction-modification system DNA methylase subunit
VDKIDRHIRPFIELEPGFDTIGHFYREFLSYTAGDKKGLGIVLTPAHICELMCDLADIKANSVVLDSCAGPGGFLIAAMNKMLGLAGVDPDAKDQIKSKQLIGIEQQPQMYTLAALNMVLRQDGKSNLYNESCFKTTEDIKKKHKPTVGLMNPPYSQKGKGLSELDFIECQLDHLVPGGIGVSIVPVSTGISGDKEIRARLMKHHTLRASITLNKDIFYPVGVSPIILVWEAHRPHDGTTWLCRYDDGYKVKKHHGRLPVDDPDQKRATLLTSYRNKKELPGYSCLQTLTSEDEWLFEAYGTPDWTKAITIEGFTNSLIRARLETALGELCYKL